ncbi:MAG: type V CRISPR-associated protein Cas12b [Pirellulaceae bacterium]
MPKAMTTTRAYTLRLASSTRGDWREIVARTHLAVNRGVHAWGEWLLSLRGGLPASLAKDHPERRVLLALSWLSVESPFKAVPAGLPIVGGDASSDERAEAVVRVFREVLAAKGVPDEQQEEWIAACQPALTARIRSDAGWVNRHKAFETLNKKCAGLTVGWATATLFGLLGGEETYFSLPDEEAAKKAEAKDFVIKAGNWLSTNWGSGKKSDAAGIANILERMASIEAATLLGKSGGAATLSLAADIDCTVDTETTAEEALKAVKQAVGWKGRPSKGAMALQRLMDAPLVTADLWNVVSTKFREEAVAQGRKKAAAIAAPAWMPAFRKDIESKEKIGMDFRTSKDHIWEYAVMLDHALRRVSAAHTWIKRAEVSRQQFAAEATKIVHVPANTVEWLDRFCDERSEETGAIVDYIIRRRATDGWDEVVVRWTKDECKTRKDRILAARDVQAEWPEDKKFGDIQLFAGFGDEDDDDPHACLADDDASCVWQSAEGPDAGILKAYVAAREAAANQQRFKVPAYRHPDPLEHPVYADFGNSRWNIEYSALKAFQTQLKNQERLASAKTDVARQRIRAEMERSPALNDVTLGLWTGQEISDVTIKWEGTRLRKDLDLSDFGQLGPSTSRADRQGRAQANAPDGAVLVAEVFNQKDWNGRLQAPRRKLNAFAKYLCKNGLSIDQPDRWDEKTRRRWQQIGWFLSFSAKLRPAGPWLDFAGENLPKGWQYKEGRNGFYLNAEANEGRKGRARLRLARLPGLRIISVDLGHRFAAACAVWQSMAASDFAAEIANRVRVAGGINADNLYLHTEHNGPGEKKRRTVYRRIGPDFLADGSPHPAPWARLDRQFLIKLQGEEHSPRTASEAELNKVNELRAWLGVAPLATRETFSADGPKQIRPRVDKVLSEALYAARLGLARHGDHARIAYALTAKDKPKSGGQTVSLGTEDRVKYLQDILLIWQKLAGDTDFTNIWAKELWDEWVVRRFGGPQPVAISENALRSESKKKLEASRASLIGVAELLANRDNSDLQKLWVERWGQRSAEWRVQLAQLRRLVLPRKKNRLGSVRRMGGLSYSRLANIDKLYKLLKSYHTQPEPHDLRAGTKRLETEAEKGFKFGDRILVTRERLRENRVKQLASRIVEGALGIGSENRLHWEGGTKRPKERIKDERFAPCHAVIVEDLENYRPEDKRPRRENRQLMNWAARNVRKFLMEGCELNGLYFQEVGPEYTSFQDSRTGAPGFRCSDFLTTKLQEELREGMAGSRRTRFTTAIEKVRQEQGTARDRFLAELATLLSSEITKNVPPTIRLTHKKGGDLFVSAISASSAAKGIQADLNAAANIGLKAIIDPDWPGAWWYVPAVLNVENLRIASPEKCAGSLALGHWILGRSESGYIAGGSPELPENNEGQTKPKRGKVRKKATSEYVNLWRDASALDLSAGAWKVHAAYWSGVEWRVIEILRSQLKSAMDRDKA